MDFEDIRQKLKEANEPANAAQAGEVALAAVEAAKKKLGSIKEYSPQSIDQTKELLQKRLAEIEALAAAKLLDLHTYTHTHIYIYIFKYIYIYIYIQV